MIFFIQSNVIHKEKQRCDANLFVFTFKTTFSEQSAVAVVPLVLEDSEGPEWDVRRD